MTDLTWHPEATAPRDIQSVAIACTLKCCMPGAKMVTVAGRHRGEWVISFEHDVEITHWMALPAHPLVKKGAN